MGLGFDLDDQEFLEVERAFHDGHSMDAIRLAQKHLRSGYHSPRFLRLVADLLEPPPARGVGRPKRAPRRWFKIGEEFYRLRGDGLRHDDALAALAKREHAALTTIRNAINYYDNFLEGEKEQLRREFEWDGTPTAKK